MGEDGVRNRFSLGLGAGFMCLSVCVRVCDEAAERQM